METGVTPVLRLECWQKFHAAFIRTVLDRTILCRFRSWRGAESARRLAPWNKIPKPERVEAAVYSTGLAHLQDAHAPFNPVSASGTHSRRKDIGWESGSQTIWVGRVTPSLQSCYRGRGAPPPANPRVRRAEDCPPYQSKRIQIPLKIPLKSEPPHAGCSLQRVVKRCWKEPDEVCGAGCHPRQGPICQSPLPYRSLELPALPEDPYVGRART